MKDTLDLAASSDSQRSRALIGLRELVLRGEFRPGSRISEVPLAKHLGVSRTPMRLAIERLAQEGLLERAGASGYRVREFSVRDIWDAIEARGVLEGAAARLAAERLASERELDPIRKIQDKLEQLTAQSIAQEAPLSSIDMARFAELNGEFHRAIVNLAKSPMFSWSLERLQSIPFASPTAVVMSESREGSLIAQAQHRQIIESIAKREGARVEYLVREHARFARQALEAALTRPSDVADDSGLALIRGR